MLANDTLKTIRQRRSVRSYKDEQIRDDKLQAVLEAGWYAPYAWEHARHFTVVQNKELLCRLNLAAKEAAGQMGVAHLKALGEDGAFDCLYGAPTLVIVSGDGRVPIPLEADCAAATQNMLLAAESLGLGSCWCFFVLLAFDSPQGGEWRRELRIPEGYKPYFSALLGYQRDATVSIPQRNPDPITYVR